MKNENLGQIPKKEVFLAGFHGDNGTAVESAKLGTISVLLHTHQTWVLDSPVTLYLDLRDVLRSRQVKIARPDGITNLCIGQLKPFGETHA